MIEKILNEAEKTLTKIIKYLTKKEEEIKLYKKKVIEKKNYKKEETINKIQKYNRRG